jgi:transposase-like protein
MMASDPDLFKGRHFDRQVIVLCVRWYLSYKLSSRDLVNMMDERGVELAHTTILRWVQRYVPEFEKCWGRYARSVGGSWRCDETYKGEGPVDVSVSRRRQAGSNLSVRATHLLIPAV